MKHTDVIAIYFNSVIRLYAHFVSAIELYTVV